MSQRQYNFKTNFSGVGNKTINRTDGKNYVEAGQVRNLCFVWLDGRRAFFNYAYLVSVILDIESQPVNGMDICFTSHIIRLDGYHLGILFDLLIDHIPRIIPQTDRRYLSGDNLGYCVTDITVKAV